MGVLRSNRHYPTHRLIIYNYSYIMDKKVEKINTEVDYNEAILHYEHLRERELLSVEEQEYKKALIDAISEYENIEWNKEGFTKPSKKEFTRIRREEDKFEGEIDYKKYGYEA